MLNADVQKLYELVEVGTPCGDHPVSPVVHALRTGKNQC